MIRSIFYKSNLICTVTTQYYHGKGPGKTIVINKFINYSHRVSLLILKSVECHLKWFFAFYIFLVPWWKVFLSQEFFLIKREESCLNFISLFLNILLLSFTIFPKIFASCWCQQNLIKIHVTIVTGWNDNHLKWDIAKCLLTGKKSNNISKSIIVSGNISNSATNFCVDSWVAICCSQNL